MAEWLLIECLLIEWPQEKKQPIKSWLAQRGVRNRRIASVHPHRQSPLAGPAGLPGIEGGPGIGPL